MNTDRQRRWPRRRGGAEARANTLSDILSWANAAKADPNVTRDDLIEQLEELQSRNAAPHAWQSDEKQAIGQAVREAKALITGTLLEIRLRLRSSP